LNTIAPPCQQQFRHDGAATACGNALAADAAGVAQQQAVPQQGSDRQQQLKEQWGIELVALRSTAAGHMLDFRFRVLDAGKAVPLFKRQTKPRLIHQKSGQVLQVPKTAKVGPLRNSDMPKQDRVYWMFFGNHQGVVQKGDRVTVAIGDFRAADLVVE
jgi:hypothetical protein